MAEMAVQGLLKFWTCKSVNKLISGCLSYVQRAEIEILVSFQKVISRTGNLIDFMNINLNYVGKKHSERVFVYFYWHGAGRAYIKIRANFWNFEIFFNFINFYGKLWHRIVVLNQLDLSMSIF